MSQDGESTPARDDAQHEASASERPLILVTNDDSIYARGIRALAKAAEALGEVWVIAPDREQSAVGHGISLDNPLRRVRVPDRERWFAISGTPADCVYFAVCHQMPRRPALVMSGVNNGNNLGDDIFYSGTVAAAIEGCLQGLPSLAVSLTRRGDIRHAAELAVEVGAEIIERGLEPRTFLNLNLPRQLADDWALRVTSLGVRQYGRSVDEKLDPRRRPYFWIGGPEIGFEHVEGTDCVAVDEGHASITPVRLEMNDAELREGLTAWSCVQNAGRER